MVRLQCAFLVVVQTLVVGCKATGMSNHVTNAGGLAVTGGGSPAQPRGAADALFDPMVLHELRFTMPPEVLAAQEKDIRDSAARLRAGQPKGSQDFKATLKVDGEAAGTVGYRSKGSFGTLANCFDPVSGESICKKFSYRINFAFSNSEQNYLGLKFINLQSMSQDSSLMREVLSLKVFRDAGIAASRSAFAQVYFNDEYKGVFTLTENVDDEFIAARWPDSKNGLLYQEAWPISESDQYWQSNLANHKSDAAPLSHATMETLAKDLTGQDKVAVLRHYMDADYMARYMYADSLATNYDGITRFYCGTVSDHRPDCYNHNFFFYVLPETNQVWLIPFDLDGTWAYHSKIVDTSQFIQKAPHWNLIPTDCAQRFEVWGGVHRPAGCDPLIQAVNGLGDFYRIGVVERLAKGPLDLQKLANAVDAWTILLARAVQTDSTVNYEHWQAAVADLRQNVLEERIEGYAKCRTGGFGKSAVRGGYTWSRDHQDLNDGSICWLGKSTH
jgi:hypothetical protein